MVSDVTLTNTVADAQGTQQQSLQLADDFNQFLILLTTQIQNQDPLNPMDSAEFTNQLVQFSQVEQSINTNQKLDDLVALQVNNIASTTLGFVGLDVTYPSAEMNYDGESPVTISYGLEETAASAEINIRNESGDLVYTAEAPREAGAQKIEWDGSHMGGGLAEPGTYSVSIDALNHEGNPIEVQTAVTGRVRGVETQNGVPFVIVGERAVPVSRIINATEPAAAAEVVENTETEGEDTPPEDEA